MAMRVRLSRQANSCTHPDKATGANAAASNPETWPVGNAANAGDGTEWVYHPGTMALQQKKDAAGQGASYTYRADGALATRTWVRGVVAAYTHNALGELTGTSYSGEPAGQAATPPVGLARDAQGRVVSVSVGAEWQSYQWNAQTGRLDGEVSPVGTLLHGYDAAGRRTGYALADGTASYATWGGWGYDGVTGKLSGVSTPEGWVGQSYHPATGQMAVTTFDVGGPMPLGQRRSYDAVGRLGNMETLVGAGGIVMTGRRYEYNDQGQRKKLFEETGAWWKYDYNGRGEVKEGEKFSAPTVVFAGTKREYKYDAIGNRKELKVGTLDSLPWMVNELNQVQSRAVEGKQYVTGRAVAASLVTVAAAADPAPDAPTVEPVERGVNVPEYFSAKINTKNAGQAKNVKVTVTEQVSPGNAQVRTGHVFVPASPEEFGYDADGNRTQDGRWLYTWDAENRLIGMKTREDLDAAGPDPLPILRLTFRYDALGRRVFKMVERKLGGAWLIQGYTQFAYDGWNLIAEWDWSGSAAHRRTYHWGLDLSGTLQGAGGVGGLVLERAETIQNDLSAGTASFFPAYDGNGNLVALYDTVSGLRAAEYEYGPFGEPLRATGPMAKANPFRWSTKYCDEETGLYYYGYRFYDPRIGRWINRDPIEENGGINVHGFVENNPVSLYDVNGLMLEKANRSPSFTFGHTFSNEPIVKGTRRGTTLAQTNYKENYSFNFTDVTSGDCRELILSGSMSFNITFAWGVGFNTAFWGASGTVGSHEMQHVKIDADLWDRFAGEANGYAGKYCCPSECAVLAAELTNAMYIVMLKKMQISNLRFHRLDYGPLFSFEDSFFLTEYEKELSALENAVAVKRNRWNDECSKR